jgi:hypothetical protein
VRRRATLAYPAESESGRHRAAPQSSTATSAPNSGLKQAGTRACPTRTFAQANLRMRLFAALGLDQPREFAYLTGQACASFIK